MCRSVLKVHVLARYQPVFLSARVCLQSACRLLCVGVCAHADGDSEFACSGLCGGVTAARAGESSRCAAYGKEHVRMPVLVLTGS